jgi:hypothetical protein
MGMRSRLFCAAFALVMVAGACSNSDSGATKDSSTGAGATVTTASSSERDTFVPISGVPGVSDSQISYAVIGTKTGNPLGTCILDCYLAGIKAYFAYQNDEGGIYQRELVVGDVLDDALSQNQTRALEVISNGKDFGAFVATLVPAGFVELDTAGVPTYVWGIHATEEADRTSIFPHLPVQCATCTSRGNPYLISQVGATKVGVLGYGVSENSKVCADTIKASVEKYSDDIGGAQVVYFNDEVAFGLPNGIAPEVTAMKAAGVQFVATCMDLNGMKTLGQELDRQGMGDVVMAHPNTYDQQFVTDAGSIFEGDFVTPQFRPFEATPNDAQSKFQEYMAKTGAQPTELAMVGWINASTAVAGLLAAGPDFDRQKVIDATNTLTDWSAGGLTVPIDWTSQHTPPTAGDPASFPPQECFAPVKIVSGRFQTVADPATPFLCWSDRSDTWTQPVPTSFG